MDQKPEQQNQSNTLFSITGRPGNIKQYCTVAILSSHFPLTVLGSCVAGSWFVKVRVNWCVRRWQTHTFQPRAHIMVFCISSGWVIISRCVRYRHIFSFTLHVEFSLCTENVFLMLMSPEMSDLDFTDLYLCKVCQYRGVLSFLYRRGGCLCKSWMYNYNWIQPFWRHPVDFYESCSAVHEVKIA